MNARLFGGVNIHEDRASLEKLDEQIERAIQELDSLNNQTNYKILSHKLLQDQYYSPSQNFAPSTKCSSKMQSGAYQEPYNDANLLKYSNQGHLQLSPENLFQDTELKELEYSSIEQVSRNEKTNYTEDEELLKQKENLNPFNMLMLNNEMRKQNAQALDNGKQSPLSRRTSDIPSNATSRILNNTNRDISPRNPSNSKKSVASIIEYHQFSNIDLPKEKIVGNSKPEHYFDSQQNLRRRQSANSQDKSYANPRVVDRLLQYGRDKDTKLKARIEEQILRDKGKINGAKPPKGRLSASYLGDKNDNDESTSRPLDSSEMADTPFHDSLYSQATAQFQVLAKKQSVPNCQMTPVQLNQMLGLEAKSISASAGIENDDDPFYQLYKEAYKNNIAVTRNNSDGYSRNQSMTDINGSGGVQNNNKNTDILDKRRFSIGVPPTSLAKVASSGSTIYQADSQHVSGRGSSKSPRLMPNCDSINPPFRPQLSKKSLELAAKMGSSSQRLMEKNDPKTIENRKKIMKEMEKELTFKPKVNKTSQQLDMQFKANLFNGDELHRWDQLNLMKEKYEMDREMKKAEREEFEKMNDECTFQPQLNPVSSRMYRDTSVDFADRCNTWKQFKEKKLNRERKVLEEKEVAGCTFQPELLTARSKLASSRSEVNLNDMSQISVRGVDQHFEKIDRANRMKKEVEARQEKFQGKGWKRQVTVPMGFDFHKRENSAKPYAQKHSRSCLDISAEEKTDRSYVVMQSRRDVSPQTIRQRETVHESYLNKNKNYAAGYNFRDAVVRLHNELHYE